MNKNKISFGFAKTDFCKLRLDKVLSIQTYGEKKASRKTKSSG